MDTAKNRKALYAKIAIGRKQLAHFSDADYRELLQREYKASSAKDLTEPQLARLVDTLAHMGATYTTPGKPQRAAPHARSDYYHIADDQYGPIKRNICAIWKRLGYDMTSLDTRVKREFGVESFAWLRDWTPLKRLLRDMLAREEAAKKARRDEAAKAAGQNIDVVPF